MVCFQSVEEERLLKRKERFGASVTSAASTDSSDVSGNNVDTKWIFNEWKVDIKGKQIMAYW